MYTYIVKNITFSADEDLLERAKEKAKMEKRSLNQLFRDWLRSYIYQEEVTDKYRFLMKTLSHVNSGRKFTREEMNER